MNDNNETDLNALPTFPEDAEDSPSVAQLPERGRTWGSIGFWLGAVLGTLFSVGITIETLLSGSFSVSKTLPLVFLLPLVLAIFFGAVLSVRGFWSDLLNQSSDVAAMRESEREKPGDREWAGVKAILRKQDEGKAE